MNSIGKNILTINNLSNVIICKHKDIFHYKWFEINIEYRHKLARCEFCPCGTTRMRYIPKEAYFIEFDGSLLRIKRNIKYLSHFNDELLHKDFKVSFIVENIELVKEIYDLFPNDYIDHIKINEFKFCRYKFGIIVPIFNRSDYLFRFLKSLFESDLENCLIVFMNESVSKRESGIDGDNFKCNEIINNINFPHSIVVNKKYHGNMFDSISVGGDFLLNFGCEYIITMDSDVLVNPFWLRACEKLFIGRGFVIGSGFNVANSSLHKVLETYDNYRIKTSVGGCMMMFNNIHYRDYIRYCLISTKWDSNIYRIDCEKVTLVTNPSVIQHIGKKSTFVRGQIFDEANDFIP